MIHMETVRLTASQALVRFLENQYISYIDMDGNEHLHAAGPRQRSWLR